MNSEVKFTADEDLAEVTPSPVPPTSSNLSGHLQDLTDRARGYVEAASSINTRKAYASDWKHFSAWCRRSNLSPLPPPSTNGRPLYHRLCFRYGRTRHESEFCRDDRASSLVDILELRATRPEPRSQGPTYRHCHGRHPQQPCPPAGSEGGGHGNRHHRHAGNA